MPDDPLDSAPRVRLGRWLAGRPGLAAVAHAVPGLRGVVRAAAEAEYREAAAAERAARGIVISERAPDRCVWCGALRVASSRPGDYEWVVDMSTPSCPGHEALADLEPGCPHDPDGLHFPGCGCGYYER